MLEISGVMKQLERGYSVELFKRYGTLHGTNSSTSLDLFHGLAGMRIVVEWISLIDLGETPD